MKSRNLIYRNYLLASMIMAALAACSNENQVEQAQSYSGKTIEILVGFNPGGGTDTNARILNKYLSKHIEGQPNVIVQNIPGGGGIRALNQTFEAVKPDGNTVLLAPISLLVPLLGEPGVRYQLDKFEVIGGFNTGPIMQFARADLIPEGLSTATDILTAQEIKLGGVRVSSSLDLMPRLALNALAKEYRYVPGYGNENTLRNAIQTSEVNVFGGTFAGYKSAVIPTLIEPGIVVPLWQFPYAKGDGTYPRSEFAQDIPTFMEVYEQINGNPPSGEKWTALKLALDLRSVADNMLLAPPGTDPEALAKLRAGFDAAMNDPQMLAEVNRVLGYNYKLVSVDFINQGFAEMSNVDPAPLELIKTLIKEAE